MSIGASYVFFLARGGWKDWPPHYTIYSPELKYNLITFSISIEK